MSSEKELAVAIRELTHFLRDRDRPATKQDLREMEGRIVAAVGLSDEDKKGMDAVLARMDASVRKFEALDAANPPKA